MTPEMGNIYQKRYYIQYTDAHRFLLKIYNIRISIRELESIREYENFGNIKCTLFSKRILNILLEYILKNY